MTPAVLAELVRSCADDVLTRRGLDPAVLPARVTVQRPRRPAHGDYATTVALRTARQAGVAPPVLAGWVAEALAESPALRSAEVAGPGFVNLRLSAAGRVEIVRQVLAGGERFGGPAYPRCPGGELYGPGVPPPAGYEPQYAHARLASLARNAAELAIRSDGADLRLVEHERETALIVMLGEFPHVVASEQRRAPHLLLRYLARVAAAVHIFSETSRVLPRGDEEPGPVHAARLALSQATRQVLANGLGLLGLSAPERM